jgi:hypothetical protein
MATYFAQVENGIVTQVIVASADFVASQPGEWVETFMDGAQRKNYAGIGYIYDAEKDAFYAPQPFPSWLLDEDCVWQAPVEYPADGEMYLWNETNLAWEKVNV